MNAMLENAHVNAKGRVKVELYDEHGVLQTFEKKNLVVIGANKIIGKVMADPAKMTRVHQTDTGATAGMRGANGFYSFQLSTQRESLGVYDFDPGAMNSNRAFTLPANNILSIDKATVGGADVILDQDVYLVDAAEGGIEFASAPTQPIHVEFRYRSNPYVEMIAGTETVVVDGVTFKRGTSPSDAARTYTIDYGLGQIYFESAKSDVSVTYDYNIRYGLAFMGIGGKPDGHPDYVPVAFGPSDKTKANMPEEFADARQPIQYPCVVSDGDPEIEVFPTVPIHFVSQNATVMVTDDGTGNPTRSYTVPHQINGVDNRVLRLTRVHNATSNVDYVIDTDVVLTDPVNGVVSFQPSATIAAGDQIVVTYDVQADSNYLNYQMSNAPILQLISVTHEDNEGNVRAYNVVGGGLTIGQGDVWLLNANAGIVQFSASPHGIPGQPTPPTPDTPGQLTFTYMVNSGTTVQFVADFPKGVPGPVLTPTSKTLAATNGQAAYTLDYPVAKDEGGNPIISITKNGVGLTLGTDYTVSADGTTVQFNTPTVNTDVILVNYSYLEATHTIYQVAMFTDKTDGEMFNIAGIGPVTKDNNTGMRITWSVTF
ncbi:hypothetical protein [Alicyclobacillus shizuokensis]|uniref:hypothetical protein n=1 Tax=Alicyclobacillus shizuokensis TaxID=392014 RepID=UPI0008357C3B|nr:hypothetical protein [Alicyclobacillus shizuokensis]